MDGISFVVAFGAPQYPRFQRAGGFWRLVIGPVVFWMILRDFDNVVERFESIRDEADLSRRENRSLSEKVESLGDKNSKISAEYMSTLESMKFLDSTLAKKQALVEQLEAKVEYLQDDNSKLQEEWEEVNFLLQKKMSKPSSKRKKK